MAEETKITGVYEIKIEQGPTLRAFEEIKKRLDVTKASIRELNKEQKGNIATVTQLEKAIEAAGTATAEQSAALVDARAKQDATNKKLAEAIAIERGLSGQHRELANDLSGLTENNLRFRDKMAGATLEALKQSGIIEQLGDRQKELAGSLKAVEVNLKSSEDQLTQLTVAYSKGEKTAEEYAIEQAQLNKQIEDGKAANILLKAELEKVGAATDTLDQRIHALNVELNAGKINTEQYRMALSKIEDETRKAGVATGELTNRFDKFVSSQGAELKSTLSGLANNYIGIGAAAYAVQGAVSDAFDTITEFDRGLSRISALGGEYAANINAIGEAAKTAGINFGFTASESLDAIEALAKAGVSTADILGGALPGALTLAAAGEVSVAEAAETASKAMTQFGLSGEQIPHLADLLAAAAATATGDVGDFNQALNQAGLVASQLNIPIEEAVGTLTAFASAGLLGSDAGTSFRTMLLRLQNPTEESAALLKQYNIDAFDLQGNFVGIENLAGQLQDRLSGLTQEQRSSALAQIFGSDAIRAANVLYTQGAAGIEKFTAQVDQSGFAQSVAAEKTNNLAGDLDKLKAQYDALILSVENGKGPISGFFRALTQGLTNTLAAFSNAENLREFFMSFSVGGAAIVNATRKIDEFKNTLDPANQSTEKLKAQLDNLVKIREAFLKQNKPEAAAEGDAMIASLTRLITAREKLAAIEAGETKVVEDNTAATAENAKAKGAQTAKVQNVADSIADLSARMSKLQEQQAQTTNSAQFATYQTQIDELQQAIDRIKNTAASDTPLIDAVFGKNLDALPPIELPVPDLTMINELEADARRNVLKAEEDMRIAQLSGARDFNAERIALQEEYQSNAELSAEEYAARLRAINQAEDEADLQAAQSVFGALQAISDTNFDSQIAQLNEQNATLQEQLSNAQDEQTKERIKGQIAAVESEKKALVKSKENFQQFSIAAALIETYLSAQKAYTSQLIPGDLTSIGRAIAAAFAATTFGLLNVAKIKGFAAGGDIEPSGTVTPSWGLPVKRANGDNVLVRAGRSFVTLKTGEKVLNEDQQDRAERIFGPGVWAALNLPGHYGGKTMGQHYLAMGYADGGTVGIVTPRPSPQTLVQSQLVSRFDDVAQRPIYTVITEVNDVQNRVSVVESARTI